MAENSIDIVGLGGLVGGKIGIGIIGASISVRSSLTSSMAAYGRVSISVLGMTARASYGNDGWSFDFGIGGTIGAGPGASAFAGGRYSSNNGFQAIASVSTSGVAGVFANITTPGEVENNQGNQAIDPANDLVDVGTSGTDGAPESGSGPLGSDSTNSVTADDPYGYYSNYGAASIDQAGDASDSDSVGDSGGPTDGYSYDAGGREGFGYGLPIVLDLDGDGVELVDIQTSTAFYDLNGDGFRTHLGWVGADDGFLAYDKDSDGTIQDGDELSFISYVAGAATDLEGLQYFDSNSDGILDSNDAEWSKFGVWQDLDQDGETDEGEFKSLEDMGITSIDLTSDGIESDVGSNHIFGIGSYTMTGGVTADFADVSLATSNIGYRIAEDGSFDLQAEDGSDVYFDGRFSDLNVNLGSLAHIIHDCRRI